MENIIKKYILDFAKVGKKEKVTITAILVASLLIGITAPVGFQKLTYKPIPTPPPIPTIIPIPATLALAAEKKEYELGATFAATIVINSPNQGVDAGDFVVNFDPDYLAVDSLEMGNYFGLYPIKLAEDNFIKVSGLANLVNNRFIVPKGQGTVATIIFSTQAATESTAITFDKNKTIVASDGKNILGKITDLAISIKSSEVK